MSFAIAMLIRPLVLFFVLACVLLPIRHAVIRWAPEGRVKRLLLRRVDQGRHREQAGSGATSANPTKQTFIPR